MGCLRHCSIEAQVAAGPQIRAQLTGPIIHAGVQMLCRQHRLSEYVAKRRAKPAAGGIDVALPALETQLHREIGFGSCRKGAEAQHYQRAESSASNSSTHRAGSTVNSND